MRTRQHRGRTASARFPVSRTSNAPSYVSRAPSGPPGSWTPARAATLSGGVDAAALAGPKKLFGAARSAEEGGSLTILATALVETGSRADDFFFEELKGTGNMELRLDRPLADRRVFPAVDIARSGTRREELLTGAAEPATVRALRRAPHARDGHGALEALLDKVRRTPDNATLLRQVQPTVPGA